MRHRIRTAIRQRLPRISETLAQSAFGAIVLVIVILFYVFFVDPAIQAGMQQ